MLKPNAGQMRGFRIVRDPDGILLNPFEIMGMKYGYVITYGEGSPAVHNGEDWVSVLTGAESEFEDKLQELLVTQGTKIAQAASSNPIYMELAAQMNIFAGAPAAASSSQSGPDATTTYFKS